MIRNSLLVLAAVALAILSPMPSGAQDADGPVKIGFDPVKKPVDLVTDREIPAYTEAVRGSIRFHHLTLNEGDEFVKFTHDGIRTVNFSALAKMEKVQEKFAIWRLLYRSGSKNTPRIQQLAVSFVPITPGTKEAGRRVYVRLTDLSYIKWTTE